MDKCRCISPCGSLPHNGPLGRKRGWYTASHIPSCPMMGLESHTFHRKSSLHEIDNQLLCKTHRGSLVIQGGRRRCPCVFQACTLLYSHKSWVDKGPHIRLICMSCQMDSLRPFDIALREDEKKKKWFQYWLKLSYFAQKVLNLHWKHSWCGFPPQSSGHLHTGMWLDVLQIAFLPQGSVSQGSTQ